MFAYCCNNPVTREDPDGEAFDTVFDILSLGSSIVDVINDPDNPWKWAGLVGDVIDVAVPFVTGIGEVTRAVKVAKEATEFVDNAQDALKVVNKAPIVIGENMKRVKQYASEIGGHAYTPWKNTPFDYDLAMKRNKRWINDMMREGREIIDIGPDFARRRSGVAPSSFYNMERTQVVGYERYKKVFIREGQYGGVNGEW